MSASRGLTAYRKALRAAQIAFNGDIPVLNAAREQIRQGFRNPDLSKSEDERLSHIEGVSQFLLTNIVQGKMNNRGKYKLNIHKETELGDNDTIFQKKTMSAGNGGGCCGAGIKAI